MRFKKVFLLMIFLFALILSSCMGSCNLDLNPEEPNINDNKPNEEESNNDDNQEESENKETENTNKEVTYADVIIPTVTVNSSTSVLYTISNVLDSVTEYSLIVKDSSKNKFAYLTSLDSEIVNLDSSKVYYISGSYKGLKDNVVTTVNVKEAMFSTKDYASLSLITKEEAIENVFSNSFEIVTEPYVYKAPSGYELGGFIVTDESGFEKDVPYNGEQVLYVDGITANTKYYIDYYYDLIVAPTPQLLSLDNNSRTHTNSINNLEYRIRFVGFWIVSGSTKSNRVRMMYNGDVLYVYYVEDNGTVNDPLRFVLPIKYENYTIVGAETYPINVTQNMDCELIMYSDDEKDVYSVIFYDMRWNAYHIEKVLEGEAAVGPATTPEIEDYTEFYYVFDGWDTEFDNITKTTHVKPKRKFVSRVEEEPHLYDFEIFISRKDHYARYSRYSDKAILVVSYGLFYEDEQVNLYEVDIDPNKTYTYRIEMKYQTSSMNEPGYKRYEWDVYGSRFGVKDADANVEITYTGFSRVDLKYENVDCKYAVTADINGNFLYPGEIKDDKASFGLQNNYECKFSYAMNYEDNPEVYYVADDWESTTTKGAKELGFEFLQVQTHGQTAFLTIKCSNFDEYMVYEHMLRFDLRFYVEENYIEAFACMDSLLFSKTLTEGFYDTSVPIHLQNQDTSVEYEMRITRVDIYIDYLDEYIALYESEFEDEDNNLVVFKL